MDKEAELVKKGKLCFCAISKRAIAYMLLHPPLKENHYINLSYRNKLKISSLCNISIVAISYFLSVGTT